jgi:hypothetical protein
VDGQSVGARQQYTFSNVTANHTIEAHFDIIPIQQYTIFASAGINGRISPSGSVTVDFGEQVEFAITPDPGYRISDVVVDGRSVGARENYQFENIAKDHSIEASFDRSGKGHKALPWIPMLLLKE